MLNGEGCGSTLAASSATSTGSTIWAGGVGDASIIKEWQVQPDEASAPIHSLEPEKGGMVSDDHYRQHMPLEVNTANVEFTRKTERRKQTEDRHHKKEKIRKKRGEGIIHT